jgi:hypothetical protein
MSEVSKLKSEKPFSSETVNPALCELSPRTCPPLRHSSLTLNEIHLLAYKKWVAAGMPQGDGAHFWLKAEMELLKEKI